MQVKTIEDWIEASGRAIGPASEQTGPRMPQRFPTAIMTLASKRLFDLTGLKQGSLAIFDRHWVTEIVRCVKISEIARLRWND
jgi:hypothetical protein